MGEVIEDDKVVLCTRNASDRGCPNITMYKLKR